MFTTAPIFLLFELNLRVSRATDHQHGEQFRNYVALRIAMLGLAFIVSLLIAWIISPQTFWVFLGIILFRTGDSLCNLSFGGFQRMQASDLIGKTLAFKGTLVIAVVGPIVIFLNGTAAAAALSMAAISIFFGLARDLPRSWKINEPDLELNAASLASAFVDVKSNLRIAMRSVPLGVDAFISSLALNSPRFYIKWWFDHSPTISMTGAAALGIFGVLSQLAFSLQMLVGAVGHTGVGMLSEHYRNRKSRPFWRLFNRMLGSSIALGLFAVVFGTLMIPPVLSHFLGEQYSNVWLTMFLLIASCLAGAQRITGRATQACGKYIWYMGFDFVICATSVVTSIWLISSANTAQEGLVAAAIAIALGFAVGLVVTLIHTYTILWTQADTKSE